MSLVNQKAGALLPVVTTAYVASTNPLTVQAPWVNSFPVNTGEAVVILINQVGTSSPGMYAWFSNRWQLCIPMDALQNYLAAGGGPVGIGLALPSAIAVPVDSEIFHNGVASTETSMMPGAGTWGFVKLSTSGFGSGLTPGNPTGKVGLLPVNGVATTFMRSDAAPPIDPNLDIIWQGQHNFGVTPLVPTMPDGDVSTNAANTEFTMRAIARLDSAPFQMSLQPVTVKAPALTYTAGQVIAYFITPGGTVISTNTAKSIFRCATKATTEAKFNIMKNDTTIGSVTFAPGAFSATVVLPAMSFAVGDVLSLVYVAGTDTTLNGVYGAIVLDKTPVT